MNGAQIAGIVLGGISIASTDLVGKLPPEYSPWIAIAGTVASAVLLAMHHQQAGDDGPPIIQPAPSVAALADILNRKDSK